MKKALHEEKEPFLLYRKGELIGWGDGDVKNLIEAANAAVINEERIGGLKPELSNPNI